MSCLKQATVVAAALAAAAAGCGDSAPPDAQGQIAIFLMAEPADITAIHVSVTANDIVGDVHTDLQLNQGTWSGTLLNVPPGTGRTVTADGGDVNGTKIYTGFTSNVAVFNGEATRVDVLLKPFPGPSDGTVNTPPVIAELDHPDVVETNDTTQLKVSGSDPDDNALLTITWSATPGGTFTDGNGTDLSVTMNHLSGTLQTVVYTPPSDFTGFVVIQVSVSDGTATATTSFPLAVGSGVAPTIHFDVLPIVAISTIQRQVLMPNDSTVISYTLTHQGDSFVPNPLQVTTTWSDDCGGSFNADNPAVDVFDGHPVGRAATYTIASNPPWSTRLCHIQLTVSDAAGLHIANTIAVWVLLPRTIFVSSATVTGAAFAGQPSAANAFCQSAADGSSSVPAGRYVALMSFDDLNARDHLGDSSFVRLDGAPLAHDKAELFGGGLMNAVVLDDTNTPVDTQVWTGSDWNGTGLPNSNCNNWSSTNPGGITGRSVAADAHWLISEGHGCAETHNVYCVQQ